MHVPRKRNPSLGEEEQTTGSALRSLSDHETLVNFVQNLREGIYVTTETGEILDANPAFLEIFGVPNMEEMKRHRVNDFVDDNLRKREIALMEREGSLRHRELEIKRLNGDVRTVLDTWYSVKDQATGETLFHGILVDITDRKDLEIRLREQSIRDPLTGCYNRRQLLELYSDKRPSDETWGCIYADIDNFKHYNDKYGHAAGDAVLVRMSHFLMRYIRAEEAVVRMGGDEFLIVLSDANREGTKRVAQRLQTAAQDTAPVSFSLGWAAREDGESFEDTVNRADRALIEVSVVEHPGSYTRRTPAHLPGPTAQGLSGPKNGGSAA
jgi:diguanylate cyclase (GGDEF)-like protein/PAS domain S-box-containing protein